MSRARVVAAGAVVTIAGTIAGCSSGTSGPAGQSGAGDKVAKIVVISPQSGENAALGLAARNGALLAIKQANERKTVPGWTLQAEVVDDKADKKVAAAAATKAASDEQVVGLVGSIFSGVTKAMLPELAAGQVPTVGPSPSNPTLTKGDAYTSNPQRPYPFFFRVIAPDDAHAPAVADYLKEKGVTSVATVSDGDSYGTGLVTAFRERFPGRVTDVGTVSTTNRDYSGTVAKITGAGAQAVFYGGTDGEAAPLSMQLKRAGAIIPLAGGDGLATDQYIPQAGPLAAGDISTAAGKPLEQVPAGQQYLKDYAAAGFDEANSSFASLSYDAATALIHALKESLPNAATPKNARATTVTALAKVRFEGTAGPVAFDNFGDVTPRVVTVQTLTGGRWKAVKSINF